MAIPFFLLAIIIELVFGLVRGRNTYRLNDTLNSLAMGSISRLQGLVILGFSAVIYDLAVDRFSLPQLPQDQFWVWAFAFVAYDFLYYWKHRFMHEVALLWGSHVAHHQSEDYNLSTALRQTSIDFYSFLFYLPLFIVGIPAEVIFTVASLNLIYQFWVHTEHIPKLGPVEWVFVTPSNHRVHHGRNEVYIDTNYGGVFILWDRIFGSFQAELDSEPVSFGLRKPLNSWNPLWANIHVFHRLALDVFQTPGVANKINLLFKRPGWAPLEEVQNNAGTTTQCRLRKELDLTKKFDPSISSSLSLYCLFHYLLTTGIGLLLLVSGSDYAYQERLLLVVYLGFAYYVNGSLMEGHATRRNTRFLEYLRLGILCPLLFLINADLVAVTAIIGLCSAVVFHHIAPDNEFKHPITNQQEAQ